MYLTNWIQHGTYQEAVSQPVVQDEHNGWNNSDWLIVDDILVIKRSRVPVIVARVFPIIDVGK